MGKATTTIKQVLNGPADLGSWCAAHQALFNQVATFYFEVIQRAALPAALGSAHSFYAHLNKWRARKEKAEAKGKTFLERPPVPPRTWNKGAVLSAGMW